jgi:hypothetical protein
VTALTPVVVNRTSGIDISSGMTTTSTADTMPAGPNNYLHVKNTTGAAVTVTVTPAAGGQAEGTSLQPYALSPPVAITTGDMIYGPFPQNPWGDGSGNVNLSYSTSGAGITVKALNIPAT